MYRAVTREIEVVVEPKFASGQSRPEDHVYYWVYSIAIRNLGATTVQLRSRYWRITDANGHVEEVRGPGVVGEQPIIEPGEAFFYTSGCPLRTPHGIMAGAYLMVAADGQRFDVEIPAFSLDIPSEGRIIH